MNSGATIDAYYDIVDVEMAITIVQVGEVLETPEITWYRVTIPMLGQHTAVRPFNSSSFVVLYMSSSYWYVVMDSFVLIRAIRTLLF